MLVSGTFLMYIHMCTRMCSLINNLIRTFFDALDTRMHNMNMMTLPMAMSICIMRSRLDFMNSTLFRFSMRHITFLIMLFMVICMRLNILDMLDMLVMQMRRRFMLVLVLICFGHSGIIIRLCSGMFIYRPIRRNVGVSRGRLHQWL